MPALFSFLLYFLLQEAHQEKGDLSGGPPLAASLIWSVESPAGETGWGRGEKGEPEKRMERREKLEEVLFLLQLPALLYCQGPLRVTALPLGTHSLSLH